MAERKKGRLKKFKILTAILSVLLILAIGAGIWLFIENQQSNKSATEFKDAYNAKSAEIDIFKQKYADEINALKEQISDMNATIEEYGKQIEDITNENNGLKEENESLKKELQTKAGTSDSGKIIYLTIDDAPSGRTDAFLKKLSDLNVKATFFVNWNTDYYEKDENGNVTKNYYQKILDGGHAIGNHSAHHDYSIVYKNVDSFKNEVNLLADNLYEATGYKTTIFRYPGGSSNTVHKKYNTEIMQDSMRALKEMGYVYFDWNIDSDDATSKWNEFSSTSSQARKDELVNEYVKAITKDAFKYKTVFLLCHEKAITLAALPQLVSAFKSNGYEFRVLSQYVTPCQHRKLAE